MFRFWKSTAEKALQVPTQVLLLEDFTNALDRQIEKIMEHHKEAVWVNNETGQKMSSINDITKALGIPR